MAIPTISDEVLRTVHAALRVSVPFESLTPLMRHALAMVAHCWRGRVPANLWADQERVARIGSVHVSTKLSSIDFKRRAAGDNE